MTRLAASCLCGGVAFTVPGPAGAITACHCRQCRKTSGHFAASFDIDPADMTFLARGPERRFRTPGGGERAFCGTCGAKLWYVGPDGVWSVEAGAVDGPTGGRLTAHIFTWDAGDYYRIGDG